jgi:hypothetical protein
MKRFQYNASFESGMWAQANSGSADYLQASNVFGYQVPRTGSWMAGESFGDQAASTFREYIKAPLTSTLVPGTAYYVEMYVSLCENYGVYGCNNHAFAFTNFNPYYNWMYGPIPLTPQVRNLTPITSRTAWTQVSGTFTATAAFTYVTIGNFNTDATTTYVYVGPGSFTYGYYYIDDASVQVAVILENDCQSFEVTPNDNSSVHLDWRVPATTAGKIFEVQRSTDGVDFTTLEAIALEQEHLDNGFTYDDATAPFNCDVHYRILQNDANGNIHYSEVKTVRLDNQGHGHLNAIYPSLMHSNQGFQVEFLRRSAEGLLNVQITDALGRVVYNRDQVTVGGVNTFWVIPENLHAGTYIVTVTGDGTRESGKIQVIQ